VALTITGWLADTEAAVAWNVALLFPLGTTIEGGTVRTAGSAERKVTKYPALPAGLVSVTVHVALCPPFSMVGVQLTPDKTAGAVRLRVNVLDPPLAFAVRIAD
jgi:hypothetical protein